MVAFVPPGGTNMKNWVSSPWTKTSRQRKIVGKCDVKVWDKLKAVSTVGKTWHVIVGRLYPTTKEDDVTETGIASEFTQNILL